MGYSFEKRRIRPLQRLDRSTEENRRKLVHTGVSLDSPTSKCNGRTVPQTAGLEQYPCTCPSSQGAQDYKKISVFQGFCVVQELLNSFHKGNCRNGHPELQRLLRRGSQNLQDV